MLGRCKGDIVEPYASRPPRGSAGWNGLPSAWRRVKCEYPQAFGRGEAEINPCVTEDNTEIPLGACPVDVR